MTNKAYRVRVVVDRDFGERLAGLPPGEPVWIVRSDANTPVAHRLWAERPGHTHLTGVVTFRDGPGAPEELLLTMLDTIDLHHGEYSTATPYLEFEAFGTGLSPAIEAALGGLGFDTFDETPAGFLATRLRSNVRSSQD